MSLYYFYRDSLETEGLLDLLVSKELRYGENKYPVSNSLNSDFSILFFMGLQFWLKENCIRWTIFCHWGFQVTVLYWQLWVGIWNHFNALNSLSDLWSGLYKMAEESVPITSLIWTRIYIYVYFIFPTHKLFLIELWTE